MTKKLALTRRLLMDLGRMLYDEFDEIRLPWIVAVTAVDPEGLVSELNYLRRQRKIRQAMYNLKKQKFIEIRRAGNKMICTLTEKGAKSSLIALMSRVHDHHDGTVCLVSFDIPEQLRNVRNEWRRILKAIGFRRRHDSLWISHRALTAPLARLVRLMKAERWIEIYEARPSSIS